MTETKHRRLAPVACVTVWGVPDGVHLSVERWDPKHGEWVTGLALCGQSAEQGALNPDTAVTCQGCEDYRAPYERALTGRPGAEEEQLATLDARWRHWKKLAQDIEADRDRLSAQLDLASEFRIPCPPPATTGPGHPEDLIVRRDPDSRGWCIINPSWPEGGTWVWTGNAWREQCTLSRAEIYRYSRDEAIAEAQRPRRVRLDVICDSCKEPIGTWYDAINEKYPFWCENCGDIRQDKWPWKITATVDNPVVTSHTYEGTPGPGQPCRAEAFGETCGEAWEQHEMRSACTHDGPDADTWFDREVCADPCGAMHTRCTVCGESLEPCRTANLTP